MKDIQSAGQALQSAERRAQEFQNILDRLWDECPDDDRDTPCRIDQDVLSEHSEAEVSEHSASEGPTPETRIDPAPEPVATAEALEIPTLAPRIDPAPETRIDPASEGKWHPRYRPSGRRKSFVKPETRSGIVCRKPLPWMARVDARLCSSTCRQRARRQGVAQRRAG